MGLGVRPQDPCWGSRMYGAHANCAEWRDVIDGLMQLAGAERTAASCSAVQRDYFRVLYDLLLRRVDVLGFSVS